MINSAVKFYRAGWRPLIGWSTVLVVVVLFVVCPLFSIDAPDKIYSSLNELFLLAAAIGGFRMHEKVKGVSK